MGPLLQPRGFWDYAIFAVLLWVFLLGLFWSEASDAIGWGDALLALIAAPLGVFLIILARGAEKAAWIARPTLFTYVCAALGANAYILGTLYVDAFVFHQKDINFNRFAHLAAVAFVGAAFVLWKLRLGPPARKQS